MKGTRWLMVASALLLFSPRALAQTATTTSKPGSSDNPSVSGEKVTFLVTVTTTTGGQRVDVGTVTFKDNGTQIGNPVPVRFGVAIVTTGALSVGTHVITA